MGGVGETVRPRGREHRLWDQKDLGSESQTTPPVPYTTPSAESAAASFPVRRALAGSFPAAVLSASTKLRHAEAAPSRSRRSPPRLDRVPSGHLLNARLDPGCRFSRMCTWPAVRLGITSTWNHFLVRCPVPVSWTTPISAGGFMPSWVCVRPLCRTVNFWRAGVKCYRLRSWDLMSLLYFVMWLWTPQRAGFRGLAFGVGQVQVCLC